MAKQTQWLRFTALCLLAGSTWVAELAFSATWPALLRLSFHDTVVCVALLSSGAAGVKKMPAAIPWGVAVWGAALFALGPVLFAAAGGAVRSSTELLVLALVPAGTVFVLAQRSGGDLGRLMPALLGLGGLALVVPFAMPVSAAGYGWLAAMVVCVAVLAVAGVRLHSAMQGTAVAGAAAMASGATAVVSFAGWLALERGPVEVSGGILAAETAWGLAIDLPLALLTFSLLREMRPAAFSTRFLVVPLVTILGGMVMVRPSVPWTTWAGLALMLGTSWLLRREPEAEDPLT